MTQSELKLSKQILAPAKTVFEAWLTPDALSKFMCPADGMSVSKAEADPQVGGKYLVVMKAGEQELPHHGVYKAIEKYSHLSFSWNNPFNETESLVSLHFEENQAGETLLTLHHTGLPSEESRKNHEGGWTKILENLRTSLQ